MGGDSIAGATGDGGFVGQPSETAVWDADSDVDVIEEFEHDAQQEMEPEGVEMQSGKMRKQGLSWETTRGVWWRERGMGMRRAA